MSFKTPILFLIFNRPKQTKKVFEVIRKIKPAHLYIAADGPRETVLDDVIKCKETRKIIEEIDWPCNINTMFRDNNLGCKDAVSASINWFFDNVEQGIILEDDCLPNYSFFSFCEELLDKYKDDEVIMHIGGTNFQKGKKRGNASYYFSRITHVWGWASWRRAWSLYDINMSGLTEFLKTDELKTVFSSNLAKDYWGQQFGNVNAGVINTWDYQWLYTVLKHRGLSIIPNVNLVENIGYGSDSTHTSSSNNIMASIPKYEIDDLIHPKNVKVNARADRFTFINTMLPKSTLSATIRQKLKTLRFGL